MRLRVERPAICGPGCTISQLYLDGFEECFILEDEVREIEGKPVSEWKLKGKTAIPKGAYNVVVTMSNRFKRDLPLLEDVPGFEGVRIHPGNASEDTEGCLLPGRGKTEKTVTESRVAFNELFGKIKAALDGGDTVTLEIA